MRSTAARLAEHQGPLGLHLIRSQNTDTLLQHSLSVAFIAMLMARELGMNPVEIEETGLAGLIHDIGELRIPSQIIQKRGELSKAEQNFLNMHPQYGLEMLNQLQAFEPRIREVAYLHHERLDGSGFPLGIKGDKIPPSPASSGWWITMTSCFIRAAASPAGAQPGDRPALQALPEEVRANPGQVADKGAGGLSTGFPSAPG
nr:HD domain-containing phosphohydrolase [Aeromonas sp. FDAARGOS 1402]